jgi:hypothetical protein
MRDCRMRDCRMRDCRMRDCRMRDCRMRDCRIMSIAFTIHTHYTHSLHTHYTHSLYTRYTHRKDAHRILAKYVRIQPAIALKVEAFVKKYFAGKKVACAIYI